MAGVLYKASGNGRDLYMTRDGCRKFVPPTLPQLTRPHVYRTTMPVDAPRFTAFSQYTPVGDGRDMFCREPSRIPSSFSDAPVPQYLHQKVVYMQDEKSRKSVPMRSRKAMEIKKRKAYVAQRKVTNRLSAPIGGEFDWNTADGALVLALSKNRQCFA